MLTGHFGGVHFGHLSAAQKKTSGVERLFYGSGGADLTDQAPYNQALLGGRHIANSFYHLACDRDARGRNFVQVCARRLRRAVDEPL